MAAVHPIQSGHAVPAPGAIGVGVVGATGYGGAELLRLLAGHPYARLLAASSRQQAGQPLHKIWPAMARQELVLDDDGVSPALWRERGVDTVFLALPHGEGAARVPALLEAGLRVVDLSADYRLRSADLYAHTYAHSHPAPHLLGRAAYGLVEWCSEAELRAARLVASPGCYATAILLGLLPAVAAGLASGAPVVVNAVSGVSGAGRAPKQSTHFVECEGSVLPYKVGQTHQHLAEIGQRLGQAGAAPALVFNPHVVPMSRGILATMAVPLAEGVSLDDARQAYAARYAAAPFVNLLPPGELPDTRHVRGSNRCDLGLAGALDGRMLLVFSAIDNLVKGAAGQAVQSWNVMQGWDQATGLPCEGWAVA